jgi:hypothetical protein
VPGAIAGALENGAGQELKHAAAPPPLLVCRRRRFGEPDRGHRQAVLGEGLRLQGELLHEMLEHRRHLDAELHLEDDPIRKYRRRRRRLKHEVLRARRENLIVERQPHRAPCAEADACRPMVGDMRPSAGGRAAWIRRWNHAPGQSGSTAPSSSFG